MADFWFLDTCKCNVYVMHKRFYTGVFGNFRLVGDEGDLSAADSFSGGKYIKIYCFYST